MMWFIRPTFVSSFFTLAFMCLRPTFGETWPPIVAGQLVYEVKPGDESITVDTFLIPDNFTIHAPGANGHKLSWHFKVMRFGEHCTISLFPGLQPAKKPKQPPQTAQPSEGSPGFNGFAGIKGEDGRDADTLLIEVGKIVPQGSLWIRTDGQTGGEGGDGGDGGMGGGSKCLYYGCANHGGVGGNGGIGGQGGDGGDAAWVQILCHDYETPLTTIGCGTNCGESSRPPSAEGDNGIIVIFGSGGCGAPGGNGGYPGGGGPGKNCGFARNDCNPGQPGQMGQSHYYDQRGKDGACPGPAIKKL